MKKLLVAAVVVALAIPAIAWSATSPKPGKYEGAVAFSVDPSLKGKKVTADVKAEGVKTVATVTYEGGREVWTWDDKALDQKELDNTGKMTMQYGATAAAPGTYNINCKDKVKNDCDAGIDSRNYWKINAMPDGFTYLVYGVPNEKKGDATVKVEKRHEFVFKTSGAATTTTTPATQAPKTK